MTLEEAKQKIQVGRRYQHYKGNIYTVDFIALDTNTLESVVVYHSDENDNIYTRPVEIWLENVNINVPRFTLLEE